MDAFKIISVHEISLKSKACGPDIILFVLREMNPLFARHGGESASIQWRSCSLYTKLGHCNVRAVASQSNNKRVPETRSPYPERALLHDIHQLLLRSFR